MAAGRTKIPVHDGKPHCRRQICITCGPCCESCEECILLCPDLCITRNPRTRRIEIDLRYCKGCGLCEQVCPRGAIRMVEEK